MPVSSETLPAKSADVNAVRSPSAGCSRVGAPPLTCWTYFLVAVPFTVTAESARVPLVLYGMPYCGSTEAAVLHVGQAIVPSSPVMGDVTSIA